jgi:hypothetical protein
MPRRTLDITSSDVPQAPNLARIRCVVTSIAGGAATVEQIADETDISTRHIGYAVRAAQVLGLLDDARAPTELGRALLTTEQESDEERGAFRTAIEGNAILRAIAPGLLGVKRPSKKTLAARIERLSGLAAATALHRASDLLAWREQLVEEPAAPPAPATPTPEGGEGGEGGEPGAGES